MNLWENGLNVWLTQRNVATIWKISNIINGNVLFYCLQTYPVMVVLKGANSLSLQMFKMLVRGKHKRKGHLCIIKLFLSLVLLSPVLDLE